MYMDLTDMISGGTEEQQIPEQKLTKEEYAARNIFPALFSSYAFTFLIAASTT